ncbi:TFC1 [Candida margitis]|uniref:TFC1 n=1 Tax=Candida margitis TaxID=1775924 RepID=UPI002227DD57|nr:TFC1 [Candida margitis]KAI5957433.1 TFC1 [Candida margitis]
MGDNPLAESYSMDIPHVAAIELPLNIKNETKVIDALGGKNKISDAIKSSDVPLELRFRKDPFHHPVQAATSTNERVLIKVSIPKKVVKQNREASVRELIEKNNTDITTPKTKIQPVAIVDKTFRFRAMSDFQVSTKNNPDVQDVTRNVLNTTNYESLKHYVEKHNNFHGYMDMNNEYFENKDHNLPPPPVFSPIKYPYDYRYQKNPITSTVKDEKSGEVKVVSKKTPFKLHTILIDISTDPPTQPPAKLTTNLNNLLNQRLPVNSPDYLLIKCIEWCKEMFSIKPIWIRRQLFDIIPEELTRSLKFALPYVTYIYRSGPWRFCNIKIGVDPRTDSSFWRYQNEYFRVVGVRDSSSPGSSKKVIPKTLENAPFPIEISQNLLFDGVNLPSAVTYQIGDILDLDITSIIENHMTSMGKDFIRDTLDASDGWINKTTMNLIRRIMRYKLQQLVREEPIDQSKIYKMSNTDFVREETFADGVKVEEGDTKMGIYDSDDGEVDMQGEEEEEEEEGGRGGGGGDDEEDEEIGDMVKDFGEDHNKLGNDANKDPDAMDVDNDLNVNVDDVFTRLYNMNKDTADSLRHLVGFIRQDDLNND